MTRCSCLLSKFEVLGSLEAQLLLGLTLLAFQSKNDLTGGLGLLVEDGLGLSTESHLFRVVTSLSLCKVGSLTRLVLSDLVYGVLLALSSTVSSAFLGYVDHCEILVPVENEEAECQMTVQNQSCCMWINRNLQKSNCIHSKTPNYESTYPNYYNIHPITTSRPTEVIISHGLTSKLLEEEMTKQKLDGYIETCK